MTSALAVDDLLLAHAAGRLTPSIDFAVAMHLAMTDGENVKRAAAFGAVGGVMFAALEPTPINRSSFDAVWQRIGCSPDRCEKAESSRQGTDDDLPPPLRQRIGMPLDSVPWRGFRGVSVYELNADCDGYRTRLIKVKAGCAVPEHTHKGPEVTLVLRGAYWDNERRLARGDLDFADDDVDHQPVTDAAEDCICLTVTAGPILLSGRFGRILNPILRL